MTVLCWENLLLMEDVLTSECISDILFEKVIMNDNTELLSQG